jgi:hypothetical protein
VSRDARAPLHFDALHSTNIDSPVRCPKSQFAKPELAMGATMPFSKYAADSDLMEAMKEAFHRVCNILQLSCDREDRLTEIIVTKIVELAKAGERDPEILCIDVLARLEMPAQGEARAPSDRAPPPMTSVAAK